MDTLKLKDMRPAEAYFELEAFPGKQFWMKKFALSARIWCEENITDRSLETIIKELRIIEISKIAYHLLKDKSALSYPDFLDNVCTQKDSLSVISAVLQTIAGAEVMKQVELSEEGESDPKNVQPQTGASSTI